MNVRVRLFAGLRETVGLAELALELPEGATVADAWQELRRRYPALPAAPALSYAVNRAYAGAGQQLAAGDEVALIPPVSGG